MIVVILSIIAAVVLVWLFNRFFKIPKCGNLILITGGVKTGKSTLSVRMVKKLIRKQRRKVWIYNHILRPPLRHIPKLGKRFAEKKDRPLVYSNIPLRMKYVPVSKDLLLRKTRFVYGSVIYLCESSLVADSMSFKDELMNEQLLLFNKLIGHETKGGYLVYDTQSVSDNHYAIKRCLNSYFYIHHKIVVPFFVILYVREMAFSDDGAAINSVNEDLEETLKRVIVPKSTWKLFDCYCYSILTDDLPIENEERVAVTLKADDIVSFKNYVTLEQHKRKAKLFLESVDSDKKGKGLDVFKK